MVKSKFELIDGITVDGNVHKTVEMNELTLGEISEAGQAAEECRIVDGSVYVVKSQVRLEMELLRRQIKSLGALPMPLSPALFDLLSRADLIILQAEAEKLDKAMYKKVLNWGRNKPESSGNISTPEPGAEE